MPMEIRWDFSELQRYAKELGVADEFVIMELYKAGVAVMDAFKQAVIGFTPSDTGKLRQGYQYDIRTLATKIEGELYSPLIYAIPMERGRQPGKMPPVQRIALWALRKGVKDVTRDNVMQVAFAIARAIGEGTSRHQLEEFGPGYKMFEQGYAAAKPAVDNYMDVAMDQIVQRMKGL